MGFLQDLVGSAQKAVGAVGNDLHQAAYAGNQAISTFINPMKRSIELVNPNSDTSKGMQLINTANNQYHFTPTFLQTLQNAYPTVQHNYQADAGNTDVLNGVKSNGVTLSGARPNDIQIRANSGNQDQASILLHEGLHQAYKSMTPQQISQFDQLVNHAGQEVPNKYLTYEDGSQKVTSQGLLNWLAGRVQGYQGAPTTGISDIQQLSPDLQNEVHSYIPEYFQITHQAMPQDLAKYYGQYYNTAQPMPATPTQGPNIGASMGGALSAIARVRK